MFSILGSMRGNLIEMGYEMFVSRVFEHRRGSL